MVIPDTKELLVIASQIKDSEWEEFEKFQLRQFVLWKNEDTGATFTLLDFEEGSGISVAHSHASNQFMYCLEGKYEYTTSKLVLTPGSFYFNPKDHMHGPTYSHKRSLLLEVYDGPHYYEMPSYHTEKTIGKLVGQD